MQTEPYVKGETETNRNEKDRKKDRKTNRKKNRKKERCRQNLM